MEDVKLGLDARPQELVLQRIRYKEFSRGARKNAGGGLEEKIAQQPQERN